MALDITFFVISIFSVMIIYICFLAFFRGLREKYPTKPMPINTLLKNIRILQSFKEKELHYD
jgi:hypothetical protein